MPGTETEQDALGNLSAAKRQLLAGLLLERGRKRATARTIRPRDPAAPCPLSRGQEQLWVAESLADGRPLYNVPYGLHLRGTLDVPALRAALDGLTARHAVLRTVYRQRPDGALEQVVTPAAAVPLPVADVGSEAAAHTAAGRVAAEPLDIVDGPVLRGRLLRISADHHLLVLVVHHIATDAWSVSTLLEELAELYDAAHTGRPPRLAALGIDYADAAAHERAQEPDDYGELVEKWRTRLATAEPLALPGTEHGTDRGGHRIRRRFDAELAPNLQRLADASRTTVFTLMLTAFAVVLYRYTGTSRFTLGTVVAGRTPQTERLIGYFANTVPVTCDLSPQDTLTGAAAAVSEEFLWAREHQIPFDVLVAGLGPQRTGAQSPLFDAMFVFNNVPGHELRLPGLSLTPVQLHSSTAKFPLDLSCAVTDGEVLVSLEYDTAVLDSVAARRLLGYYERLLTSLCTTPDATVATAAMLSPTERELAVGTWNRTRRDFPDNRTAHGMFEDVAARQPDAPAVVCGDETVTYRELDERANQLAHALRAAGCGRNDRVGVCLARGVALVVAQLAVLKAGAGYVPLDPGYPAERLRWMLTDSGARFVIGADAALTPDTVTILDPGSAAAYPTTPPGTGARPGDLMYLIYTSGSTGTPKGVLLDHRGRVNNFTDFNRRFRIGAADRVFGVSALAFDMSAYDVFGTLMAGAAVVFPEPAEERSPDHWIDVITREHITVWHSVPALFGLLIEEAETRGGPRLPIRLVLLGGDWIPLPLPGRAVPWLSEAARLVSMGGATEVSMDSTLYEIATVAPEWRSIPYGAPMANQTAYVLDAARGPLPVGIAGELYLGGAGVGWGYHNRARLTAERFVPDPFGPLPGARMYRTGDRARWRPDGTLELLGRIDHQIKINGYRVETGEIEAALVELLVGAAVEVPPTPSKAVREPVQGGGSGACLVAAHGARDGAKTLVAYLVAAPDSAWPDDETLRRALSARLPEHMVPRSFVRLEAFPLNSNGKVDRKALPAPGVGRGPSGRAPATATERRLAALWRETLQTGEVPADAGFFTLGGNSISVIRLVSAARRSGLALSPRMVFAHQTIEELAAVLDANPSVATTGDAFAASGAQGSGAPGATPGTDPVPSPQQRHMLRTLQSAWVPGLYQMQSTLRLPFDVDPDAFATAWRQLTRRHETLRTAFSRHPDGTWTRTVADELEPEIELLDWRERDPAHTGEDLNAYLERARAARPACEVPPLWRVWLVRGVGQWWLGQVQSYLLADGWSNLVLLDELLALYLAAVEGRQPDLAEPVDTGAFGAGADPAADTAFWRNQLAGAPPTRLAGEPGGLGPSRFRRIAGRLAPEVAERLRKRAADHGHTFSTVLCTGWSLLAAARLDRDDVTVGVVSAGRDEAVAGMERGVGLFAAALPVRLTVDADEPLTTVFDRFQLARAEGAEHMALETGELQQLGAGQGPLFDSVIVVANYPMSPALRAQQAADDAADEPGVSDGTRNQTEFSLRLDITEDAAPRVVLSYYADRIAEPAAAALLDGYLSVLHTLAQLPGTTATAGHVLPVLDPTTGDHR